ncbi:MAG: alpha-galactosidase [Clostridium sp.]|nr:alpha-galactosidase [Clostridium sp.]
MKKTTFLAALLCCTQWLTAAERQHIRVSTDKTDLVMEVGTDGRLRQTYLGASIGTADLEATAPLTEAYLTHGMEDYFEPSIRVLHNDGNPSLLLTYKAHQVNTPAPGVKETVITLTDEKYPVTVDLHYVAYQHENVIKTFTEISHKEKKPVTLYNYNSGQLTLDARRYFLTEFSGEWAYEANMNEQELFYGKKVLDTKLGTRANMFCSPFFMLSLNEKQSENSGDVVLGTLGWTGNYRYTFEVDNKNMLRVLAGINPYGSEYSLNPGEVFRTPDFYFTFSNEGCGAASRNFHDWARRHQVKDGNGKRLTLLNNWEATYFDFNEEKLIGIMDDAKKIGVDMFLLDDGWFANKYPRSSDTQGLGDWEETRDKLPNGVARLVKAADEKGVKFGIWIEPEMVNPKSELYEKHKDWVIHLDNREEYYFRNQMVLDLANPKVQDHVFGVVDRLMTENPNIAFFKWDCNSPITNIYSPSLGRNKQSHLYIEYVRGLYKVLDRVKAKYPDLPMMLCAGGGGRCDYEALRYFTEFWPSDNTNPVQRLFIQWGYSYVFPSKVLCAHVTNWNRNASLKFRTDVAMMCKLGFDIEVEKLSADELAFTKQAVVNFNRLSGVILDGDLYRLFSPYEGQHMSVMHVAKDKRKAVVYAYDAYPTQFEMIKNLKLDGLNPKANYRIEEINLMTGQNSSIELNGKTVSGAYLMNHGLKLFSNNHESSRIVELTAE